MAISIRSLRSSSVAEECAESTRLLLSVIPTTLIFVLQDPLITYTNLPMTYAALIPSTKARVSADIMDLRLLLTYMNAIQGDKNLLHL